jgi:hypothetical protein
MSPTSHAHTYGSGCLLSRSFSFSGAKSDDDIPPLKSQFFYASQIGIDDPLSAVPIPGSKSKTTDHLPRPFSAYDNIALEEAWMSFSTKARKRQKKSKSMPSTVEAMPEHNPHTNLADVHSEERKEEEALPNAVPWGTDSKPISVTPPNQDSTCCPSSQKALEKIDSNSHNEDSPNEQPTCCPPQNQTSDTPKSPLKIAFEFFTKGKAKEIDNEGDTKEDSNNESQPPPQPALSEQPTHFQGNDNGCIGRDKHPSCCEDLESGGVGHDSCKTDFDKPVEDEATNNSEGQTQLNKVHSLDSQLPKAGKNKHTGKGVSQDGHESLAPERSSSHKSKDRKRYRRKMNGPELSRGVDGVNDSQLCLDNDQNTEYCKDHEEHKIIEQHTKCKSHQAFESHFLTKHNQPEPENGNKENKYEKQSRSHRPRARRSGDSENGSLVQAQPGNQTIEELNTLRAPNPEAKTTGRPFLRLPSRRTKAEPNAQGDATSPEEDHGKELDNEEAQTMGILGCKARKNTKEQVDVPVGVSRLHHVQLPSLQMKPIYWSPVHDIAAVTRGTWFYKDIMYPVEPADANQLEIGYRELRPWSETWSDELKSAMDVGAEAEEKITHQLWPKDDEQKPSVHKKVRHTLSADPYCAAQCFNGAAAAEGGANFESTESTKRTDLKTVTKKYPNCQVIYKDAQNAFILKPALQPSAYYGRKPLQKIQKGQSVGIHVVRGFDWKVWDKLHPSKKSQSATKAEDIAPLALDVDNRGSKSNSCPACKHEEERPKVTDVIFVIHGIGQKLSERMESFHFTHAINAFRREVNLEISHPAVQTVLREELGGVMVLPINWRTNLSFEDGGPMTEEDQKSSSHFTLDDITPNTIPAVRNMISDVMLDIPFYMSHHKPKMIQAVVTEANRVYRLWCQNNPEFVKNGRVHIIAHSLGSAMALDILSKQPTSVPKVNLTTKRINTKHLDFSTTNLFLAGSPAGFFLLLEKAMLLPRKGQGKPDAEHGDDTDKALTGDPGTFGCLAVDNIYNIMHYNDPIAYRMNAAVDPQYAASLKSAQVPGSTTGFLESIGLLRPKKIDLAASIAARPRTVTRLPSQLEMDVHDFTREEIAEKKFMLLNDNGQIDWFLSSGGGPLEIQYINMLGAHSSYWLSHDFVRFIVVEVGRKPGKSHALAHMKAVKKGHVKVGHKP